MSTLPTSALMIHFKDYEQSHQTRGNKLCHYFGLPGVTFSLLGLLSNVILWAPTMDAGVESIIRLDLGLLLWLFGSIFAFRIDRKLAIPFTLFTYVMYLLSRHVPINALIALQIVAWIFQFVGHYHYEKKSPAFLSALSSIFIGPMWLFAYVIGYYKPWINFF